MNDQETNSGSMQVKRITLVDAVVDQMIEAIRSGRFKPGDKIPSEKILIKEFGVSRTTLREAFKKLEHFGAISIRQGSGTYLLDSDNILPHESREPVLEETNYIQETIHNMFSIGNYHLTRYLEARECLEVTGIGLAAERATEQDLQKLEQIIIKQESINDNPSEFIRLDYDFHKAVIIASKNEFLYQFWLSLTPFIEEQVSRVYTIPGMIQSACSMHKKIYNSIKKHDAKKGKALIVEHLRTLPGRMLSEAVKHASSLDQSKHE